jgi:hypothetical protein
MYGLDFDRDGDDWSAILDTPPAPYGGDDAFWAPLANACDDSGANDVRIVPELGAREDAETADERAAAFTLNPLRHDIMSKGAYVNCDEVYRVTPEQARAMHENLWRRAEHWTAAGPN